MRIASLITAIMLSVLLAVLPAAGQNQAAPSGESADYIHSRLGMKYKSENRLDDAIEEFRRVLAAYPDNYNAYMQMADISLIQGKASVAAVYLKKALDYNPGWSKAKLMLGKAYELDGQFDKAAMELQEYKQICDPAERDSIQTRINYLIARSSGKQVKPPDESGSTGSKAGATGKGRARLPAEWNVKPVGSRTPEIDMLFKKAVALYDERKFDEASRELQKVLNAQPGHPGAYYYAGLIRRRMGDNEKAKTNFLKAIAYPDLGYNAHFYLGKIYGDEKKYSEAIRHLEAYMAKTTNEGGEREARELITRYRAALSDSTAQAHAADSAASVAYPLDLEAERGIKATAYGSIEIPTDLMDSMLFMTVVDTLSDAGQKMLDGVREFKQGRFDKAVAEFKKVLIQYPNGAVAVQCMYNTGLCYYKMRLFKESENQFNQIIQRYPTHQLAARAAFLKAVSYLERKDSQRAEVLFRDYIRGYPKHAWVGKAYEKLGDAYIDLEKPKMAVDAYTQAAVNAQSADDQIFAQFKLGSTCLDIMNPAKALAAFQKVIELGEKNSIFIRVPDSYYKIADYYYQQKNYVKALDYYKKAAYQYKSYHETPWGLFQIGSIYKNLGKYQQAVDTYKQLIRDYKGDYWANQADWKLNDAVWENEYKAVLK
jgi:tetratricopeptide (TPR) repeat protein